MDRYTTAKKYIEAPNSEETVHTGNIDGEHARFNSRSMLLTSDFERKYMCWR